MIAEFYRLRPCWLLARVPTGLGGVFVRRLADAGLQLVLVHRTRPSSSKNSGLGLDLDTDSAERVGGTSTSTRTRRIGKEAAA